MRSFAAFVVALLVSSAPAWAQTAILQPIDGGAGGTTLLNVMAPPYNAKCDDVADDTAALTAVGAAARSLATAGKGFKIVFSPGVKCKVTFPGVNWTSLNVYPSTVPGIIDGNGAVIDGQVSGAAVIDLLGSTTITIRDLQIVGAGATTGIQWGRWHAPPVTSADRNLFENVSVLGTYTLASCYNNGSEINTLIHVKCYNSGTAPTSYAAVFDGANTLGLTSQFLTMTLPVNSVNSLVNTTLISCDLHANAAGHTLYLANTSSFRMEGGYILNQANNVPVVLNTAVGSLYDTHIHTHMENQFIPNNFLITGSATPTISIFDYRDDTNFATTSIFALDTGTTAVTFTGLDVAVSAFFAGAGAHIFDTAANYTLRGGMIMLPSIANWAAPASSTAKVDYNAGFSVGSGATWNIGGLTNVASGVNSTISGGSINTATQSGATVTGGSLNTVDGSFSRGGGVGARSWLRQGVDCYAS